MKPSSLLILLALAFTTGAALSAPPPPDFCTNSRGERFERLRRAFTGEGSSFTPQPGAFTSESAVHFVSSPPVPRAAAEPDMQLPDAGEVFNASLLALLEKRWSVAIVGLLLVGIFGLRKVGGAFIPFLKTDLGGAALAVGAGALYTAYKVLAQAEDPTIGLVLVAAASGAWSWASKFKLIDLLTAALTPPSKRKSRAAIPADP